MATPFTWDDLQYFLAVARTGHLSSAARSLRTSHATVSRHIDRLEFSLKTKLFERNPRGYELTTVGRRLVDTVERIEQRLNGCNRIFPKAAASCAALCA